MTSTVSGAGAPSAGTRLGLLGGFAVAASGEPVALPQGAQRLIAFLALHRRPLHRAYVAGTLWIDGSQEAANANLRTALWRLRRCPHRLVEATASHLSLAPAVRVDVDEVVAVARRVAGDGAGAGAAELGILVPAGDLLPDWYDDWVAMERERLRQLRLHALERLCDELAIRGEYARAIEAGLAAVAAEPLRESAHRAVMRAHLAEGNRGEALRQYRLCRCLLRDRLGLEPSVATRVIEGQCRAGDGVVTGVA